MRNVLITGANGFVGHHVVGRVDTNVAIFTPSSHELDLMDQQALKVYCYKNDINSIIHLASLCGGIGANKVNPAPFIFQNLQLGINVLEVARICQMERVVNLGTVCMYPKFSQIPFVEDDIWEGYPEETNAPYGIAKKTVMEMGIAYHRQYGLQIVNLVPVNMGGEFDHFDLEKSHVLPALIRKFEEAKKAGVKKIVLWGTGNASREFLYAGDCASLIWKALIGPYYGPSPINVGTGDEITIANLALMIKKIGDYKDVEIEWDTSKPDGQPRRCLDVSKAKNVYGWSATTPLSSIVLKTIKWYREQNNS